MFPLEIAHRKIQSPSKSYENVAPNASWRGAEALKNMLIFGTLAQTDVGAKLKTYIVRMLFGG